MSRPTRYWMMKSEPDAFGIDDLQRVGTEPWNGVRNYQARNFMRDGMRVGDGVMIYHSNCKVPGIAGLARVASVAYPDETQFDRTSKYYDPKATRENPRWMNVDVKLVKKTRLVSIKELRSHPELASLRILQKGNRLSITPVDPKEYNFILTLL